MSDQTVPRGFDKGGKPPSVTLALLRLLEHAKPLRTMPVWSRYAMSAVFVLIATLARYMAGPDFAFPSIPFVVAFSVSALVFDRGSGIFATLLSAFLSWYFFPEPGTQEYLSLVLFVALGLFIASIIEALRFSVEQLALANEKLAAGRDELRRSTSILETIIESNPDATCVKDLEGRYVHVNSAFVRLRSVPAQTLIGKRARDFRSESEAALIEAAEKKVMETRTVFAMETRLDAAGEPRWYFTSVAPWYGPGGELAGIIETARDVHARKEAEDKIRAANAQKEILLQDVNHRVKNHFQSAIAMLNMELRSLTDPAARDVALGTINRLQILSRVYDRLWIGEDNEPTVNALIFIEDLCADLRSGVIGNRPIDLVVKADPLPIEAARATAVGLFINEALTNAVKHAFPEGREGTVSVSFGRENGSIRLEVADDGVGESEDSTPGTGMKLMSIFSQQLRGTLEHKGPPGTALVLVFPADQHG
jgi:PAS domain S-box-containing protein